MPRCLNPDPTPPREKQQRGGEWYPIAPGFEHTLKRRLLVFTPRFALRPLCAEWKNPLRPRASRRLARGFINDAPGTLPGTWTEPGYTPARYVGNPRGDINRGKKSYEYPKQTVGGDVFVRCNSRTRCKMSSIRESRTIMSLLLALYTSPRRFADGWSRYSRCCICNATPGRIWLCCCKKAPSGIQMTRKTSRRFT